MVRVQMMWVCYYNSMVVTTAFSSSYLPTLTSQKNADPRKTSFFVFKQLVDLHCGKISYLSLKPTPYVPTRSLGRYYY
jgi:hypothetical protein